MRLSLRETNTLQTDAKFLGCEYYWVIYNFTIWYSAYDFLFNFKRNYVSILYHMRNLERYLSKVADFNVPHLHLAPPLGMIPIEFYQDLWREKTSPVLLCGDVCAIIRVGLAGLTQYWLVRSGQTDRQTDGQTQGLIYQTHDLNSRDKG